MIPFSSDDFSCVKQHKDVTLDGLQTKPTSYTCIILYWVEAPNSTVPNALCLSIGHEYCHNGLSALKYEHHPNR